MWSIHLVTNTVEVNEQIEKDLRKASKNTDHEFDEYDCVIYRGKLSFNPDHYEHMDWLTEPKLVRVLKKHKVKGDIGFADLEGDGYGNFWGYRFDGKGGMVETVGEVVWNECTAKANQ